MKNLFSLIVLLVLSTSAVFAQTGFREATFSKNDSLVSMGTYEYSQVFMEVDTTNYLLTWGWRNNINDEYTRLRYLIYDYSVELADDGLTYYHLNCTSLDGTNQKAYFILQLDHNSYSYRPAIPHEVGEAYYVCGGDGITIKFI